MELTEWLSLNFKAIQGEYEIGYWNFDRERSKIKGRIVGAPDGFIIVEISEGAICCLSPHSIFAIVPIM